VTIVGDPQNDFIMSRNYKITVGTVSGSPKNNPRVGQYTSLIDRMGKEFKVNVAGSSVFVYREDFM